MTSFGAYGIATAAAAPALEGDLARLLEEIRVQGYGALTSMIPTETVDHLNAQMDAIYARQCAEVGGEDGLMAMKDADIARCLLAYSPDYMALATHPTMIAVAQALLGENLVLLMQNGVINRPERIQAQARWHRDLNYQHWVCSRPLAMGVLVCLEDFNIETGGTTFLPGSHLAEDFPSEAVVEREAVTPDLPRGSVIFFNAMTFHRAGVNQSGRVRRAVNHVIGAPILSQQVDIPSMLDREAPADPWLAGYLGYRWNPTRDVSAWRRQRIAQATAAARDAA
ncbi:MAG: Phytanoyl-CoA dioxygenase [Caulobacteraceae bacterium]|nr:Phytanoyl-CoA dioxygenase [Caulobacteraceae bacterium]